MAKPLIALTEASLAYGGHRVWDALSLVVEPGEAIAVLGPNGSGKTSLLRVILGLAPLRAGTVTVFGAPPRRGSARIGYVPQVRAFDPDLPLCGRDLVGLGLDGHRWGLGRPAPVHRRRIEAALEAAGAGRYADVPIGRLSGGEQQRVRIAQALVAEPELLLCDEPLAHLDLRSQQEIVELIAAWRRRTGRGLLFVTHDVNPVLGLVDRVLFVVHGRWADGTPDAVLTSERLSELYGSHVDVLHVHGRLLVIAEALPLDLGPDPAHHLASPTGAAASQGG